MAPRWIRPPGSGASLQEQLVEALREASRSGDRLLESWERRDMGLIFRFPQGFLSGRECLDDFFGAIPATCTCLCVCVFVRARCLLSAHPQLVVWNLYFGGTKPLTTIPPNSKPPIRGKLSRAMRRRQKDVISVAWLGGDRAPRARPVASGAAPHIEKPLAWAKSCSRVARSSMDPTGCGSKIGTQNGPAVNENKD